MGVMVLKARIQNGRIVAEAPAEYPEGAEVEIEILERDYEDDMTEEELAEVLKSIEISRRQFQAGEYVTEEEFLAQLRAKK
jgi:hypothetical protein